MYLRMIKKNEKEIPLQPTFSSSGPRVARAYPSSSGCEVGTHRGQATLPPQGHAHPHSLRLGPWRGASSPDAQSWGCGRKLESPEETHADLGRLCKPHRQWPCSGINFFFLPTL